MANYLFDIGIESVSPTTYGYKVWWKGQTLHTQHRVEPSQRICKATLGGNRNPRRCRNWADESGFCHAHREVKR